MSLSKEESNVVESDELIRSVGVNIQEKAALIWSVADTLRGPYKPHEYGLVILPMTVIKRFHDCLLPTHDAVLAAAEKYKNFAVKDGFLREASGYPFYNTSKFTFETLKADPENIEENFKDYLNGFSDNVQDILARMKFLDQVERLSDPDAPLLYQVVKDFCSPKADMSPDKIKAVDMGYIFENLIQRFSESYDEDAGAHFTSRDIVYLMTDLLIAADPHVFDGEHIVKTVYDQTMGTSQMLGCTEERLRQLDADARVTCFGQEFNPFTFGIAKASALIRGEDDQNMQFGDTLSADKFGGFKFDYCISNPPFGDDWKLEEAAVRKEAREPGSRFSVALPSRGDGQMLFLLNGISKLKDDGLMVIVQDASPLYKGKPESGEDRIRAYILENDWLDAIVRLCGNAFYNTGLVTFLWIINKKKPSERAGKVQLIDASNCFVSRNRPIGKKRNDITASCRDLIVRAYSRFETTTMEEELEKGAIISVSSLICNAVDFGFNRVIVHEPLIDDRGTVVVDGKGRPVPDASKDDSEDIPLTMDVDAYMHNFVIPFNESAWADSKKRKPGYTIPFTRFFYQFERLADIGEISRILSESTIQAAKSLGRRFDNYPPIGIGHSAEKDWLGDIPEDWELLRMGDLFELRSTKVSDEEYSPLSVTKNGIVPQLSTVAKSDNHSNRKLVRKGDFAINSRSDRRNSCGFSPYEGSVSTITTVLYPRRNVVSRYFDLLFHTPRFAEEFYRWGHGIDSDIWTTTWSDMKKIIVPHPPIAKQNAIVDYLAKELKEIRAVKKLIEAELDNVSFDLLTALLGEIDCVQEETPSHTATKQELDRQVVILQDILKHIDAVEATFVYEVTTGKREV